MLGKKTIIIVGLLLITCISTLAVVFGLSASDALGTNKRTLTISTASAEKTYDGTPLSKEGFEITDGSLKNGHTMTVKYVNSITEVGSVQNTISVNIIDKENVDVTGDYDIKLNAGTLAILPRSITVASETVKKIYAGTEIDYKKASISAGTLADGQEISYTFADYVDKIGETTNQFTATILDANDNEVTQNYNISYLYGKINLSQCTLAIRTDSITKEFDGKELTSDLYEIIAGSIPAGLELVIDYHPSISTVTKASNEFQVRIIDTLSQKDVSEFFNLMFTNGTLEISKRPLAINIKSASKEYDGKALSCTDYTIASGSIPEGYGLKVVSYPEITDVTSVENELIFEVHNLTTNEDVTKYFDIINYTGALTIKKCNVVVETPSTTQEYNGEVLKNTAYTLLTTLPVNFEEQIANAPEVEGVGEEDNKITFKIINSSTLEDCTSSFNITYSNIGKLVVTKRVLTITTGSTTKTYDGKPLTNNTCKVTSGKLPSGFALKYDETTTPSITEAGTIKNEIEYTITYNDNDVTSFCDITDIIGNLIVKQREITIKTCTAEKPYDGTPIDISTFDIEEGSKADTDTIKVFADDYINIGQYKNESIVKIYNAEDKEVTDSYIIKYKYGYITITKRPISIKTSSKIKDTPYDGTSISDKTFTHLSGDLLTGDTIKVLDNYTPTLTNAGDTPNDLNIIIVDSEGNNVSEHYEMSITYGKLVINKRPITVTSKDLSKTYDGTALTASSETDWSVTSSTKVVTGETITVSLGASITEIGERDNTIYSVNITKIDNSDPANPKVIDSTNNYEITKVEGTLTIERVYGSASASGELLSNGGFGTPDPLPTAVNVATINAEYTGLVYLKSFNYKDISYVGGEWKWSTLDTDDAYPYQIYGLSADYLSGIALAYSGATNTKLTVTDSVNYVLPYYLSSNTSGYTAQTSDVKYAPATTAETYSYYAWSYMMSLNNLSSYTYGDDSVSTFESAYKTFVYSNYLNVNSATKTYLDKLITDKSLSGYKYVSTMTDKEYVTAIRAITQFVRNAAEYKTDYDRDIDTNTAEPTIAFFEEKEGICQHFALAGTMLLRALGYPARYTVGFVANATAGVDTVVTSDNAHAWVEVYHDGLGWIQLEMTAGYTGDDYDDDSSAVQIRLANAKTLYSDSTNIPLTWEKVYGSTRITDTESPVYNCISSTSTGVIIDSKYDYTTYNSQPTYFKITTIGTQSSVGTSYSTITEFALLDSDGNDITEEIFGTNIKYVSGKLQVYYDTLQITSAGTTDTYDGEALTNNSDTAITSTATDWTYVSSDGATHTYTVTLTKAADTSGTLTVIVTVTGTQTDVGTSQNTFTVKIMDGTKDVTQNYNIQKTMGFLTVNPISITITAGSDSHAYVDSDEVLTCSTSNITSGSLLAGHSYTATTSGSIAYNTIGEVYNTIASYKITRDSDGADVTSCYNVSTADGKLTITAA